MLDGTLDHWRDHVRELVAAGTAPNDVHWIDSLRSAHHATGGLSADGGLFGSSEAPEFTPASATSEGGVEAPLQLPRRFVERLKTVSCFRSESMWSVAYRLLYRVAQGERDLLDDPLDPDVTAFQRMEKAIRRDAHKMHAFVRFRRIEDGEARGGERFIAWYEPSHLIVERESEFFRKRFPSMDWSILSPDRCAHWDGTRVTLTEGATRDKAPTDDELEELWCAYYASIFNPARVKLKAMTAEMPKKFWHTLPETQQIPELLADVPRRLAEMAKTSRRMAESAMPFVPSGAPLDELRGALQGCEGCELFKDHTRAVPGEGQEGASIALLGEQPGDTEERLGRPFAGPAGRVLDGLIEQAGLDRADLYLTNAVKHFRHEVKLEPGERGKRRIHKRPTIEHVSRCQPWVDAEMQRVRPDTLLCLGVTAARSVFGPTFRSPEASAAPEVRSSRYAKRTIVTFHPAAILRARSSERKKSMEQHMLESFIAASRPLNQSEPNQRHS